MRGGSWTGSTYVLTRDSCIKKCGRRQGFEATGLAREGALAQGMVQATRLEAGGLEGSWWYRLGSSSQTPEKGSPNERSTRRKSAERMYRSETQREAQDRVQELGPVLDSQ